MCYTRQARLVYDMITKTWFIKDRLPLGHLSPRLKLKGSHCFVAVMVAEKRALDTLKLAVKYLAWKWQNDISQYLLTRTGHIAPLNHRGQGSTFLSCAQNVQKSGILADSTDECHMYYMAQIKHPPRPGGRVSPTTVDNM